MDALETKCWITVHDMTQKAFGLPASNKFREHLSVDSLGMIRAWQQRFMIRTMVAIAQVLNPKGSEQAQGVGYVQVNSSQSHSSTQSQSLRTAKDASADNFDKQPRQI